MEEGGAGTFIGLGCYVAPHQESLKVDEGLNGQI